LTFAGARPSRYSRLRAWIERVAPAQERFPDGPVIAALWNAPDPDAADVQQAALAELKRRFHGPAAAITRRPDTAKLLHKAGWQTFHLGEAGEVGEGVTALKGWSELASHLSK
jgi:hypothetical protein